jgi:dUTP pyrophosphatase
MEVMEKTLVPLYEERVKKTHGTHDSGFDLLIPEDMIVPARSTMMIDLRVRFEPLFKSGYFLFPRSSIAKTPLRLSNSVGIIDCDYRGPLKCAVDNTSDQDFNLSRGERYFQVCHPSLHPLEITLVSCIELNTTRGEGGFGSTGR